MWLYQPLRNIPSSGPQSYNREFVFTVNCGLNKNNSGDLNKRFIVDVDLLKQNIGLFQPSYPLFFNLIKNIYAPQYDIRYYFSDSASSITPASWSSDWD